MVVNIDRSQGNAHWWRSRGRRDTPGRAVRSVSSAGDRRGGWLAMAEAYLVGGVRTPIGRYGGALAGVRTDDLAAHPIRALLARYDSVPADAVEEVVLGCANQAGEDNRNVARMALLLAGLPDAVPGVTVNRLCGSGLDAVVY